MPTPLKIAHILRKYNAQEWAGTETVLQELIESWNQQNIHSTIYSPKNQVEELEKGVVRYQAFLPIAGLSKTNKERLYSIGGNLMSFDLGEKLKKDHLSLIHSHTMGFLGAIGEKTARKMGIPFVLSIHGGALDLPQESLERLIAPQRSGIHWGKIFSLYLRPDKILDKSDAIITFNSKEEQLLREKFPDKRIVHIPHGIDINRYEKRGKSPQIKGPYGLVSARIDPIKNQLWVLELLPAIRKIWPGFKLVMAGPVTDENYYNKIKKRISDLKLEEHVVMTGGLMYSDPQLIGLLQEANVLILPSLAEPFGRVILEAWAAGIPVLASRTSGPLSLIKNEETGVLFNNDDSESFLNGVEVIRRESQNLITQSKKEVKRYDIQIASAKVLNLYQELISGKVNA